jgi:hypothetical protein
MKRQTTGGKSEILDGVGFHVRLEVLRHSA